MIWTNLRIKQLEQLRRLLNEASSLNSGNNVIERMGVVINLAKALQNSDLNRGHQSFIQFLIDESFKEDKAKRRTA